MHSLPLSLYTVSSGIMFKLVTHLAHTLQGAKLAVKEYNRSMWGYFNMPNRLRFKGSRLLVKPAPEVSLALQFVFHHSNVCLAKYNSVGEFKIQESRSRQETRVDEHRHVRSACHLCTRQYRCTISPTNVSVYRLSLTLSHIFC